MILERKKIQNLHDFFVELGKRNERGVYFYRINGVSDDVKKFLIEYCGAARKSGVVIEDKIGNPTESNLAYYNEIMGVDFQMNQGFISQSLKKWLPRMNAQQRENVAAAMYDTLMNLRQSGKTDNMLKNAYIKFMCWLYYKFERIVNQLGQDDLPKIMYIGGISNYELMLLSILSGAGCDVVLIQKNGDTDYLKLDAGSVRSDLYNASGLTAFPENFSLKSLLDEAEKNEKRKKILGSGGNIIACTNAWMTGDILQDIMVAPAARGKESNMFFNAYCRINGVENKLTYPNELYQFYLSLTNEKRNLVVVNEHIPKPANEEIMNIKRGNYTDVEQMLLDLQKNIQFPSNQELRAILVKGFIETMTEEASKTGGNLNKLVNKAVYLLCWLKRYQKDMFQNWKMPNVGCFIYMGGCRDQNETLLMKYFSKIPVDVLILCPNLNEMCCLEDSHLYEMNYQNIMNLKKFPEKNTQFRIGTAAYHAERELDTLMYDDAIIFRDQQFKKADAINLQIMDREIKILWKTELKFRPNFSTVDDTVNIPVIFTQISGISNKDINDYWIEIKNLMTPETIVIDHAPYLTSTSPNPVKMYATEFYKNGKLQRNKIKDHPCYQYGFLREEMQEHMLDKLESIIEQKIIKGTFENGTEYTIIAVALNLPKDVTRLIQRFDFTKINPKLLYINTSESLISLEDSIYVTYLNMIGFDIVFYVPTGYNMGNYFNQKVMEEHQAGEFVYDLQLPDWDAVPLNSRGKWRDKIFKRG